MLKKTLFRLIRPYAVEAVKYLLDYVLTRIMSRDGVITPEEQAVLDTAKDLIDKIDKAIKK